MPVNKPPRRFLETKLWSLNRIFRSLGFVLCIVINQDKPRKATTLHFSSKKAYDRWCEQFKEKRA